MSELHSAWAIRLRGYFYPVGPMYFDRPVSRREAMRRARAIYGKDLEGVYPT